MAWFYINGLILSTFLGFIRGVFMIYNKLLG